MGAVAQLGERLLCKQEVVGSIPSGSTKIAIIFGEYRLHEETFFVFSQKYGRCTLFYIVNRFLDSVDWSKLRSVVGRSQISLVYSDN